MLPLHVIIRNLLFVPAIVLLFHSCSIESEKELTIIKAMEESLDYSNRLLSVSTSEYLTSLNAKLNDIGTSERASVWLSKAQAVESLSKEANDYIAKIKAQLSEKGKESKGAANKFLSQNRNNIFDFLIRYKKEVLAVDDRIHRQFSKSFGVVASTIDTLDKNENDLFNTFFQSRDIRSSKAMLTKLQNNIKVIENKVTMFCHEQVGSTGGPCTFISAIAGINSSVVQPGGQLEIFSGVGSFDSRPKAEVFVYDNSVPVNENAIAVFRFKAEKQPGKYYVPVKINYTDQDGRRQSIQKQIEYTVANIQKE